MNKSVKWKLRHFPSGTIVVEAGPGPHFAVCSLGVLGEDKSDEAWLKARMPFAVDLVDFLNSEGKDRPEWMDTQVTRSDGAMCPSVSYQNGIKIEIRGPFIDKDPPKLNWTTDPSDLAIASRFELWDLLL